MIPRVKIVLNSPLNKNEIFSRLERNIAGESKRKVQSEKQNRAYVGQFQDSTFHLERFIEYRNDFLPIIRGKVIEIENGCNVFITLKMDKYAFFFVMIIAPFAVLISTVIALVNYSLAPIVVILAFLAFLGLGLTLFYLGIKTSKRHLIRITQGVERNDYY